MPISPIAVALAAVVVQQGPAPSEEAPTFEHCVYTPADDRNAACAPILEAAVTAVNGGTLDAPSGGPVGSNPWVEQTCTRENLRPDQTTYACRQEAHAVYTRARLAHRALNGLPNYGGLSVLAEAATARTEGYEVAERDVPREVERERCRRSGSSWRDEDTGESEAEYRVTCSWSSDPESEAAARRMLEEMLRD